MSKKVAGVFAAGWDAKRKIESLKQDGIDEGHIHVLKTDPSSGGTHNTELDDRLEDYILNLRAQTLTPNALMGIGMEETDANRYLSELRNGNILVLVDSDHDRYRTDTLTTENFPDGVTMDGAMHGEKVDNYMSKNRFNDSAATPQEGRFENPSYADSSSPDAQPGRPKEKSENQMSMERRTPKEYEEETSPFEQRTPESYQNKFKDQPEYGNTIK